MASSLITVAEWDSTYDPFPPSETGFMLQQLAPNNKIYLTTTFATKYYHIIDQPDSPGVACNVIQHGIDLITGYNNQTIPNHPNYFLGPVIGSVCDSLRPVVNFVSSDTTFCSSKCVSFSDLSTKNPVKWKWFFPGAVPDTSIAQNPVSFVTTAPAACEAYCL